MTTAPMVRQPRSSPSAYSLTKLLYVTVGGIAAVSSSVMGFLLREVGFTLGSELGRVLRVQKCRNFLDTFLAGSIL
jgi:hypothetical protein